MVLQVEAAAEMFVRKGDVVSELYTQTAAMHSAAIRAFAPRLPPATRNAQITVERRMHNMVFDNSSGGRNDQYRMLVGKELSMVSTVLLRMMCSAVSCIEV